MFLDPQRREPAQLPFLFPVLSLFLFLFLLFLSSISLPEPLMLGTAAVLKAIKRNKKKGKKAKVLRVLPSGRTVPHIQGFFNFTETRLATAGK